VNEIQEFKDNPVFLSYFPGKQATSNGLNLPYITIMLFHGIQAVLPYKDAKYI
jgi:hypothetical protein